VHLPIKVREEVSFQAGCMSIWSDEKFDNLAKLGDAVEIGYGGQCRIVQHHASTAEEALTIVDAYRRFAQSIGWPCVLRGQTRDYYGRSGRLMVLPAIMRSTDLYLDFKHAGRSYRDAVRPWLEVLRELEIFTGSGVEYNWSSPTGEGRLPGKVVVNAPAAIMRANPVVAGILQRYGLPRRKRLIVTQASA